MALVQTEVNLDRLSDGRKRVKCTLSTVPLALVTGIAEIKLDNLNEVTDFFPVIITPAAVDGYVFEYAFIKEVTANFKNGITITVMKMEVGAVAPAWGVAATADIADVVIEIECIGI